MSSQWLQGLGGQQEGQLLLIPVRLSSQGLRGHLIQQVQPGRHKG